MENKTACNKKIYMINYFSGHQLMASKLIESSALVGVDPKNGK